jgi:hypothetical protein
MNLSSFNFKFIYFISVEEDQTIGIFKIRDFDENSSLFRWKLENVTDLEEKVESEIFFVGGHPWKVILNLMGTQSPFLSIFVVCEGF